MKPIRHKSNNMVLGAPIDWDNSQTSLLPCDSLPATQTTYALTIPINVVKSYWQPSEEEIANILAGMPVCLYVVGTTMPVVALNVEE